MAFFRYIYALILVATTRRVYAQIQATTPGPNETYRAGSPCKIAWDVDTSNTWKDMTIDLMSGSNNNMSLVMNVATDVDGTDNSVTPYSWTCPEVDPYAPIYFYQFSDGSNASTNVWTTRFTITSPSNQTVTPEYATQPDGQAIPWGIGQVKAANSTTSNSSSISSSHLGPSNSVVTVPPPTSTTRSMRPTHDGGSDVSNGGYISGDTENQDIEGNNRHEGHHGHGHEDEDGNEGNDETLSSATANRKSYEATATANGSEAQASNVSDANDNGNGGGRVAKTGNGSPSTSNSAANKAGNAAGSEMLSRSIRAAVPSTYVTLLTLLSALAAF